MDDSKTVSLGTNAIAPIEGWLQTSTPTLIIRCKQGKLSVWISTDMAADVEYGTDTHSVTLRFDEEKPLTQHWDDSTDNKGLFAPKPVSILYQLVNAERMRFQFTPFSASPAMAEIRVGGLQPYIEEVENLCKLKRPNGKRNVK